MEEEDSTVFHASEDEFEGFSESDLPTRDVTPPTQDVEVVTPKLKSVVVIPDKKGKNAKKGAIPKSSSTKKNANTSTKPVNSRGGRGNSKSTSVASKPSGSSGIGSSDPSSIFDVSKLNQNDLNALRAALCLDVQNDQNLDNYVYDYDDDLGFFPEFQDPVYPGSDNIQPGHMRISLNTSDISDDDKENEHPPRYRIPKKLTLDDTSVCNENPLENDVDTWALPKLKTPDRGEPISDSLANLFTTACKVQCDTEPLFAKYPVPSNCESIIPPEVNQEFWRILDKKGHDCDKAFVAIQNLLSTSMVPIMTLISVLKTNKSLDTQVKSILSDMITGLGQVQYSLSLRRRYYIRPYLRRKYSSMCNMSMPITNKLFGDEVVKEAKACDNVTFLGRESSYQGYNFRGPMRSRGRFRGRRGYPNTGYFGGYQANRSRPYPPRGGGFRGTSFRQNVRAPRRRPSATVTSASMDPNEETQ